VINYSEEHFIIIKTMKNTTTILATLLFLLVTALPFHAIAQEESQEEVTEEIPAQVVNAKGLRATFSHETQDPSSKEIKFIMTLESDIDSDRVKVTWDVAGNSALVDRSKEEDDIVIESGAIYTIPVTIRPVGQGVTELFGKVEAFEPDGTQIVTVRKNFATNAAGEMLPISDEYSQAKVLNTVFNIAKIIVIFVLAVVFGFIGFKFFVKWLKKDEVQAYEQRKR
jgi:uncharacterized protein YneF (UPF0154 family)